MGGLLSFRAHGQLAGLAFSEKSTPSLVAKSGLPSYVMTRSQSSSPPQGTGEARIDRPAVRVRRSGPGAAAPRFTALSPGSCLLGSPISLRQGNVAQKFQIAYVIDVTSVLWLEERTISIIMSIVFLSHAIYWIGNWIGFHLLLVSSRTGEDLRGLAGLGLFDRLERAAGACGVCPIRLLCPVTGWPACATPDGA